MSQQLCHDKDPSCSKAVGGEQWSFTVICDINTRKTYFTIGRKTMYNQLISCLNLYITLTCIPNNDEYCIYPQLS